MKKLGLLSLVLLLLVLSLCAFSEDTAFNVTHTGKMVINGDKEITFELYGEEAPLTVENFVTLVKEGFYDGLTFHCIIAGFMIQGGDPLGTGTGGSENSIKGEFPSNGVQNNVVHTRGVLSMARAQDPNSASSQFFIMHQDAPHLNGMYAAFGSVTSGMEVVDEIVTVPTDFMDYPKTPVIITSITIDEANEQETK